MKVTDSSVGCIDAASSIIGDKWTPQLLRVFINSEVVRFCELQDKTGGINPRTLSSRLTQLEEQGIIKRLQQKNSSRCEYILTEKGSALLPILKSMEAWSRNYS